MGNTYQSTIINAPIEKVWESISNFHNMDWAPNVITKVDQIGEKPGTEIGSKRVLNDAFHETLLEVNAENFNFTYSIDEGPSPLSSSEVNNYRGHVQLTPATLNNSTLVEWSSQWENNDEPVHEFCHGIYVALLNEMKANVK